MYTIMNNTYLSSCHDKLKVLTRPRSKNDDTMLTTWIRDVPIYCCIVVLLQVENESHSKCEYSSKITNSQDTILLLKSYRL